MLHLPRRQSISVKLPALISALLVVAIAIFSFVAHRQLKQVLLATAASRVTSATHVLGGLFDDSEKRLRAESDKMTSDSAMIRFATAPSAANRIAAQKSLAKMMSSPGAQQTIGVELRDKQQHRVLWVDGPAADSATYISRGPERPIVTRGMPIGRLQAISSIRSPHQSWQKRRIRWRLSSFTSGYRPPMAPSSLDA